MLLLYDATVAKHRHEDLIREAQKIRLVRMAEGAKQSESLLSRMVKLLSSSSAPSLDVARSDRTPTQQELAHAKNS
jgi:hypothetical protein